MHTMDGTKWQVTNKPYIIYFKEEEIMKSFFKKLAFVMAMAMVVTLAAPAAANADGLEPLVLSVNGVASTEETIAMDETVDFGFLGAKDGWRDLIVGWKSSNEAVAKVDGNGLVTPVAPGTTVISYELTGYEVAKATVTVEGDEPVVVEPDFDYTQKDLKTVVLDFGQDVSKVKKENVELYRVFMTNGKPVEVFWPINAFTAKDNTITLSSFTQLGDGATYVVKVAGLEPQEFTSVVPELTDIDNVTFTYGTDGKNGQAFVYDEETLTPYPVTFKYALSAAGMDVTDMFKDFVQVEYTLLSPDPEDEANGDLLQYISFFGDPATGSVSVMKEMTVVVGIKAVYQTEDGTPVEIPAQPQVIEFEKKPEIGFAGITGWTIWNGTDAKKVVWYDETTDLAKLGEIPAGDAGYKVVLKVKDTRGNEYVTDPAAAKDGLPFIGNAEGLLNGKYWFKYYSTNTDTFLVNESGSVVDRYAVPTLTTYTGSNNAVIYVAMYTVDEAGQEVFVDNVYAFRFKIGAEKKHVDFKLASEKGYTVNADALNEKFVTTSVTVTPIHQYNGGTFVIEGLGGSSIGNGWNVTCSNDKVPVVASINDKGVVTVDIDGRDLYAAATTNNFTYTVTVNGLSKSFTITLKRPNWRDFTTEYARTNGESGFRATNYPANVTNGEGMLYDILIDVDAYGLKRINMPTAKPVKLSTKTSGDGKTNFEVAATVEVNKSSSSVQVGSFNTAEFIILNNKNWATTTGQYHKGDRLVALLDGNGKMVLPQGSIYSITPIEGGFKVQFTQNDNGVVTYAKADNYKLAVYTVTAENTTTGVFTYTTTTAGISVADDRNQITAVERKDNDTALTIADPAAPTQEELAAIVVDAFKVSLAGSEWKLDNTLVKAVEAECNGEYVIIKNVTFNITVDKSTTAGSDVYTSAKVPVNMSVKLGYDAE